MPGPCNSKKKRKQQSLKEKGKQKSKQRVPSEPELDASRDETRDDERVEVGVVKPDACLEGEQPGVDASREEIESTLPLNSEEQGKENPVSSIPATHELHSASAPTLSHHTPPTYPESNNTKTDSQSLQAQEPTPVHTGLESPFISDPGNGPRVKDTGAFLASFFCPPPSLEDETCVAFAREGVLHVLEAILPREIALIVWFNKTRKYRRICPACQRLYRLGDALADPISGELVDVYNTQTPPQVLREQQMSGICSSPCFLLASYTSHPYVAEVARGAWGQLAHELSAQTRALLDTTDPATAALMRFGLDAWEVAQDLGRGAGVRLDDLGLGRVLRMTRRVDMGIGDVLKALAWAEAGGDGGVGEVLDEGERREGEGRDDVYVRSAGREMGISAPVGIRA